jgi:23S rRNA pseudouridine2605 synthase
MNNKEGNNKRSGSSRPSTNKPKPAMAKRSQKPKKTETAAKAKPAEEVVKKPNQAPKRQKASDELRLNKYISNSGACSRRDADIYIQSGNVKVNGIPVTEMGYLVKLTDVVNFDGTILIPEKKVYILLNKPKNFTTAMEEHE